MTAPPRRGETVTHVNGTEPPDPSGLVRDTADPGRREAFLPSPCVQNHAANLMPLPDGDLGCVWFGGTQEGLSDISVYFSRLAEGADAWSPPVKLSGDPDRSEQNPVLFPAPDGALWLLHTAQHAGDQDSAFVRRRVSRDGGRTWGPAETMFDRTADGGVFVRQPLVELAGGGLLLPVFRCAVTPGRAWAGDADTSAVRISGDGGATWSEHAVPGSTGCVHMNVVRLGDGELFAVFRSRWADSVYASRSADEGRTWTVPEPTELPNNNSSLQLTRLGNGDLLLAFNDVRAEAGMPRRTSLYDEIGDGGLAPAASSEADAADPDTARTGTTGAGTPVADATEAGTPDAGTPDASATDAGGATGRRAVWGTPRAPLTLAVSKDGGRTWPYRRVLADGDGYCMTNDSRDGHNRELSYPSVAQTPDGRLHVAYTHHRRAIKYVGLDPDWVTRGDGGPIRRAGSGLPPRDASP